MADAGHMVAGLLLRVPLPGRVRHRVLRRVLRGPRGRRVAGWRCIGCGVTFAWADTLVRCPDCGHRLLSHRYRA